MDQPHPKAFKGFVSLKLHSGRNAENVDSKRITSLGILMFEFKFKIN